MYNNRDISKSRKMAKCVGTAEQMKENGILNTRRFQIRACKYISTRSFHYMCTSPVLLIQKTKWHVYLFRAAYNYANIDLTKNINTLNCSRLRTAIC